MKKLLVAVCVLALASPVLAADWNEVDDAPELPPGQTTVGDGSLDNIFGSLTADEADMYCVDVADPAAFRATTCNVTTYDTQLFLFDMAGYGVSFNDDDPGGCGLQSTVTGAFMDGAGQYLLAISSYNYDPESASGYIWENSPYGVERAPDGPGALDPVIAWFGSGYNTGAYQIALVGAGFCEGGGTPIEPASWGQIKSTFK